MNKTLVTTIIGTSMLAIVMGPVKQVNAADFSVTLPKGMACPDFDLTLNIDLNDNRVYKEFTDKDGNIVRVIEAGKGNELEFVNDTTGATFEIRGNGSVSHTTLNPDETQTVSATGHNVIILFPTDYPPGPTTTQYVGRVVYTIDSGGVWTLQDVRGESTDICDALLY